jgi:uncharacterized protein (TIGR04255 family)
MAFPDAPRVIYENNPLQEVICQLRFPPVLRIDAEPPAAFQEQVRADYPFYELKSAVQFPSGLPPEIAQMVGAGLPFAGQKWHEFASKDRAWDLKLNRESISLACRSYTRWEDFRQRLARPFEALMTQYQPSFVTRIGLRYQDVIRRSPLDLKDAPWNQLLQPWVTCALGPAETAGEVENLQAVTIIRLPNEAGKTQVSYGLGKDPTLENETVFVIDTDFFTEQQTDPSDVFQRLDALHRQAGLLFRWCITDRLHEAMGPHPLPAV